MCGLEVALPLHSSGFLPVPPRAWRFKRRAGEPAAWGVPGEWARARQSIHAPRARIMEGGAAVCGRPQTASVPKSVLGCGLRSIQLQTGSKMKAIVFRMFVFCVQPVHRDTFGPALGERTGPGPRNGRRDTMRMASRPIRLDRQLEVEAARDQVPRWARHMFTIHSRGRLVFSPTKMRFFTDPTH